MKPCYLGKEDRNTRIVSQLREWEKEIFKNYSWDYIGLVKNFVWLVNTLFNGVLGENEKYVLIFT